MKITCKNEQLALELSKKEYIKIIEASNKSYASSNPECMYDVREAEENFPDTMVITEDMLDEYEGGFVMWYDDFFEVINEFVGYLVGNIPDFEKEFTIIEEA